MHAHIVDKLIKFVGQSAYAFKIILNLLKTRNCKKFVQTSTYSEYFQTGMHVFVKCENTLAYRSLSLSHWAFRYVAKWHQ